MLNTNTISVVRVEEKISSILINIVKPLKDTNKYEL